MPNSCFTSDPDCHDHGIGVGVGILMNISNVFSHMPRCLPPSHHHHHRHHCHHHHPDQDIHQHFNEYSNVFSHMPGSLPPTPSLAIAF